MENQKPIEIVHAVYGVLIGLGLGVGGTLLIQHYFIEPPMPPGCSRAFVLEYVNESVVWHYQENTGYSDLVTDVELHRPLEAKYVRTLNSSQYGNDCQGEVEISYRSGTVQVISVLITYETYLTVSGHEWARIKSFESQDN